MNALKSQVPNGIQIHTLFDRSVGIQESVQDVKFTLLLTLALVVIVIFLFLETCGRRSSRASRCRCRSSAPLP